MYKNKTHHHSLMDINNINLDDLFLGNIYINDDALIDDNIRPIVAGHIGNYVDPNTHQQFRVFMTRNRQIIYIPEDAHPQLRRERTSRQESARQRKNTRRAVRREAMGRFMKNQAQIMFSNPHNIFNPQLPPAPMARPASPVHEQEPDPNSGRSRRKQRRQQQQQPQPQQPSNVISQRPHNRVVGGAKTKTQRRRRH